MLLNVVQDCRFNSAKTEIVMAVADFRFGKTNRVGIAVGGELVDDRTAGIAEGEEARDFVVGFAGGVVTGATDAGIGKLPGAVGGLVLHFVDNGVAAGNDQADGGKFGAAIAGGAGFEKNGVDVAGEMVHGEERLAQREGESFAVGEANEQGADEARALSDGDGVEIVQGDVRLVDGFADDWDDLAEMFAGGKFGDDPAVFAVNFDLGRDHAGEDAFAVGDDGGGGFVAGGFDAENEFLRRVHTKFIVYAGRSTCDIID